ncbi:DoxX family membrane protein [Tsukamurella pulmonis]|nr:DoxX family membrane protein [Tsukamurella pulmonis]
MSGYDRMSGVACSFYGWRMESLVVLGDRLFLAVTGALPLRLVVWPVRVLLAAAFVPSGAKKVLGQPFTQLPSSDPVGGFFAHLEAMPSVYWLVGISQLVAAVLLLVPWLTIVGALIYLPVSIGIVVVTWTLPFENTRFITAGMLVGVVFLLCWEWPRLRYLLLPRAVPSAADLAQ